MSDIDRAMLIAVRAHTGQRDLGGQPYILHVLRVMHAAPEGDAKMVAVLHDTLEDTWVRPSDLQAQGFQPHIVEALVTLSRHPDADYEDHIRRVALNPLARAVKICDLKDNLNRTRIARPSAADHYRWDKYDKALAYLQEVEATQKAGKA